MPALIWIAIGGAGGLFVSKGAEEIADVFKWGAVAAVAYYVVKKAT